MKFSDCGVIDTAAESSGRCPLFFCYGNADGGQFVFAAFFKALVMFFGGSGSENDLLLLFQ